MLDRRRRRVSALGSGTEGWSLYILHLSEGLICSCSLKPLHLYSIKLDLYYGFDLTGDILQLTQIFLISECFIWACWYAFSHIQKHSIHTPGRLRDEGVFVQPVAGVAVESARLHWDSLHAAVVLLHQTKHLHHTEACKGQRINVKYANLMEQYRLTFWGR